MKLYKFKNYDDYVEAQKDANVQKLNYVWAEKAEIRRISEYIRQHIPEASFGICHGSRNGMEVKWFREFLGINVIGTDISETAKEFPDLIQWDFHEVKDEWLGNVDFIYSNSLDHSYDPEMCLDRWMKCLKNNGLCFIEWTKGHKVHNRSDPFGGSRRDYANLIKRKYEIRDILQIKSKWLKKNDNEILDDGFIRAACNEDRHIFVVGHKIADPSANKPGLKAFIDLGAFTGDTLKLALERYSEFDKFYAFEPLAKNYELLCKDFSGVKNVTLLNEAAYIEASESKLYLGDKEAGDQGGSLCANKTTCLKDRFETVKCIDFSAFLKNAFSPRDYIVLKVDIEGKEYDLFDHMIREGSIGYIKKIYCEWHYDKIGVSRKEHLKRVEELNKFGFKLTGYTELDQFPVPIPLNAVRRRMRKYRIFLQYHLDKLKNKLSGRPCQAGE